ncbi:hypothetical protein [Streptomyces lydicus]|uniref:hypothetical protein n=1 Tax=Streptomyces lydicus TaxID=47763 RepID=UPI001010F190|nr:hypothetical protein [Streptomyces lydicus]MCZ1006101.1 hypothetical protein [Streptomyces lydicus]
MVSANLRLLPWPGPAGQRSYLSTDDGDSPLAQLADEMEEVQLQMGAELLDHAAKLLEGQKANAVELRFLSARLCEALRDALRVAESRGERLPEPDDEDAEQGNLSTGDSGTIG